MRSGEGGRLKSIKNLRFHQRGVVALREAWWLSERRGGSLERRGGSERGVVAQRKAWWLNLERRGGSMVVHQTIVLQSRVRIRRLSADCPSPGGLPPEMALGRELTSVRGNRGKKL